MEVATYLVQFLKAQGITHVFGLPGGENVLFLEALCQAGVDFVLVHHEASAGFAAGVSGQLLDRPGVCLSTLGPGAVNLLATTAAATQERSPMLAITADLEPNLRGRVTHMHVDIVALFKTCTKGSFTPTADTIAADLATAWQLAQTPPYGAVHLAISSSVAAETITVDPPQLLTRPSALPLDPAQLEPVRALVEKAKRPFLMVGIGIEMAEAQSELIELVGVWQIPVAVTPKAKGHFPENHPLFAGCFTAYGDQPVRRTLGSADLIIGIGLDGVDFATSIWDIDTPVINLAPAEADDPVFQPSLAVTCDLKKTLKLMLPWRQPYTDGVMAAANLRQAIAEELTTKFSVTQGGIRLGALIAALRRTMPIDGAVTVDVGAFKLVLLQQWRSELPKTFFVSNGFSAMGYAIPGALAIKLAQPERTVAAVVGDGALLMYTGELETVVNQGCPILILVVVDEALALIRLKQLRQNTTIFGTEFGHINYAALADAFDLGYQLIDDENNTDDILRSALQQGRPILVEARIHLAEYDHFK